MAFDSISAYAITKELNSKLQGKKVNKIYQIKKDEINLHLYENREHATLFISASSDSPCLYISNMGLENPTTPPSFCMLLRKYLQGSIIREVRQVAFDRIIEIDFETINEISSYVTLTLIVEIMGRNSNITLINKKENRILDSIKHITFAKSSFRQVLPNQSYIYPPMDRINPTDFEVYEAYEPFLSLYDKSVKNALFATFNGISPIIAKEICFISSFDESQKVETLSKEDIEKILNTVKSFFSNLDDKLSYFLYEKDNNKKDFNCCDLEILKDKKLTNYSSPSKMIEEFYLTTKTSNILRERYEYIFKAIEKNLNKELNKEKVRKEEYQKSENSEIYNQYGQILLSNLHKINKGDASFKGENFYDEMKEITIPLDERLNPTQNANKYFKKYTKAINAKKHLEKLLEEVKEEIFFLESTLLYLKECESVKEIEEIEEELKEKGYIKNKKKKKNDKIISTPHHFISKDGFNIYVGKNALQNDLLTKSALKEDIWLHTKDIPSSHVILRTNSGKYSNEALLYAAKLTSYFSKAKDSSSVPVDYTYIKYVKKIKASKLGKVIYTDNKTIYITLSQEEKEEILKEKTKNGNNN